MKAKLANSLRSDSQGVVPSHVAIIMDGNGRWARRRFLPRTAGHREGAKTVRRIAKACDERGVRVLTLFAFSSENWQRPAKEVHFLMDLFLSTLRAEIRRLQDNNMRLRFIGDRGGFSLELQTLMSEAETLTATNTGLLLVIAANYGGRWDITQAAKGLAKDALAGRVDPDAIGVEQFHRYLSLHDLPEPDLFIRTGGEQRISNFMLWQLAYTELHFTDQLWPDYDVHSLEVAFSDFATRQRRFGRTGEQVEGFEKDADEGA
ncbi:MAG: di-trans,poly-cis-decaprenylcistransferase [Gammaproteobacteria bacterium]|nr:di-trans,poly-cis-decaprenylcistransferase [Gammaproteobacteria bacterium]MCP5458817.1 di-trans,poly-cis-decaprenylcistransferase [Gammaproteobacteria bacterium]